MAEMGRFLVIVGIALAVIGGHRHAAGAHGSAAGTAAGGHSVSRQEHYFLFSARKFDPD